jgi:hypothetical protein
MEKATEEYRLALRERLMGKSFSPKSEPLEIVESQKALDFWKKGSKKPTLANENTPAPFDYDWGTKAGHKGNVNLLEGAEAKTQPIDESIVALSKQVKEPTRINEEKESAPGQYKVI